MTEFGKRGVQLLKEIASHDQDSLPAYNEEVVRLIVNDIKEHQLHTENILRLRQHEAETSESVTSEWEQNPADAVSLVVHFESIKRNKRLMLSYMLQRTERLKYVRWNLRCLPQHVADACSPPESEFYKAYDRLLTKYMSKANGIGLDLTLESCPPKDNNVQAKVMQDHGEAIFSFGRTVLRKGLQLFLPADEAEPLVKAGILQLVDRRYRAHPL